MILRSSLYWDTMSAMILRKLCFCCMALLFYCHYYFVPYISFIYPNSCQAVAIVTIKY